MPVQTRIQIRRGTTDQWAGAANSLGFGILYEGELGFDTDLKLFKIGDGTLHWTNLASAGGSAPVTGSGMIIVPTGTNQYAYHSIIAGSGDGISTELVSTTSGSSYSIGLSNKLESFHDSNIGISSTSGISISGLGTSTIDLNPGGGIVTASGINIRNITEGITVTSTIGGLSVGTSLTTASGITDILKKMLQQVFEPTVGANPNFTLSLSNTSVQEIGTSLSLTVSATSPSSGTILGTGLGASWNGSVTQRSKVGAPTGYSINNNSTTTSSSLVINPYVVQIGSNTFPITTYFNSGTLPVNSLGNVSTSQNWTSITAATGVTNSSSFTGFRGVFYGVSSANDTAPTTSAEIRALSSGPLNLSSNATFVLTIPSGTKKIIVAFPSGVQSFTNTKPDAIWNQVGIKAINGANAQELYSDTVINVSGASSFTAIPYFVKYFIPSVPIPADTAHSITIK